MLKESLTPKPVDPLDLKREFTISNFPEGGKTPASRPDHKVFPGYTTHSIEFDTKVSTNPLSPAGELTDTRFHPCKLNTAEALDTA